MPTVQTFNEVELKAAIERCPAVVREYITALKSALSGQTSVNAMAKKRVFELAAEVQRLGGKV
jgi:hypothetical protein